jgi:CheY-like chemotaxis protein
VDVLAERPSFARDLVRRMLRAMPERTTVPGLRVLVVEDIEEARYVLVKWLERAGAQAVESATVQEAIERATASMPEVAVIDIALPGEDGYAFARWIREREAGSGTRIPLIAISSLPGAQVEQAAKRAGFDVFLQRPHDPDELLAVLARLAGSGT